MRHPERPPAGEAGSPVCFSKRDEVEGCCEQSSTPLSNDKHMRTLWAGRLRPENRACNDGVQRRFKWFFGKQRKTACSCGRSGISPVVPRGEITWSPQLFFVGGRRTFCQSRYSPRFSCIRCHTRGWSFALAFRPAFSYTIAWFEVFQSFRIVLLSTEKSESLAVDSYL